MSTDSTASALDDEAPSGPFEINPEETSGRKEAVETFSQHARFKQNINRQFRQDMLERRRYAKKAFELTRCWTIFLIAISFAQLGFSIFDKGLNELEFVTLVTTTTGSVLGVWFLVGKYLFEDRGYDLNRMLDRDS